MMFLWFRGVVDRLCWAVVRRGILFDEVITRKELIGRKVKINIATASLPLGCLVNPRAPRRIDDG